MKTFYIYRHTNLINGKVYIGQTCQKPEYRWGKDGNGYKNSPHFYSAIQQYGWNAFQHEILYSGLTQEEANKIETELILKYDSNNPNMIVTTQVKVIILKPEGKIKLQMKRLD